MGHNSPQAITREVHIEHLCVAKSLYYEAGINWPKKFPSKNMCWKLILRVFLFCRELFGQLIPAS
jgi:hypothetical protein